MKNIKGYITYTYGKHGCGGCKVGENTCPPCTQKHIFLINNDFICVNFQSIKIPIYED